MGNDMHTYGSGLRLAAGVSEQDLLELAKAYVLCDGVLAASSTCHRYAEEALAHLAGATTLEQLLGPFQQVLVRDGAGEIVAMVGANLRYHDPEPLLVGMAPGLVDGSWIAFWTDYGAGDEVLFTRDGEVEWRSVGERFLDIEDAKTNIEWGYLGNITEVPFTEGDSDDVALTKLTRAVADVPDLIGGVSDRWTLDELFAAKGATAVTLS